MARGLIIPYEAKHLPEWVLSTWLWASCGSQAQAIRLAGEDGVQILGAVWFLSNELVDSTRCLVLRKILEESLQNRRPSAGQHCHANKQ